MTTNSSTSSSRGFDKADGIFFAVLFLLVLISLWFFSSVLDKRQEVHVERYQAWQAVIDQTEGEAQKDMLRYARSEVAGGSCGGEEENALRQGSRTNPMGNEEYRALVLAIERDCMAQFRGKILVERDNTQLLPLLDRIPIR